MLDLEYEGMQFVQMLDIQVYTAAKYSSFNVYSES